VPEEEWLLEPGDMLYLPPGMAHLGVAEGPCFTYSIGFLAPTHAELIQNFLEYLGATLAGRAPPDARYRDPDLRLPQRNDPHEISASMHAQVAAVLGNIRIPKAAFGDFLGRFLTRPKPHVRFRPPARPVDPEAFAQRLRKRGRLSLALPSRGLGFRGRFFLNGHAHTPTATAATVFARLVRDRALTLPIAVGAAAQETLYDWYAAGYVTVA